MQTKSGSIVLGNALKLSPQQRARICSAIRRELDLEHVHRTNARREILARLAIGLPPYRRNFHWEQL